jgi:site-specific DNA recombinase
MTIAAIYARKSTEQAGIADEQKSVARQVEHARTYAARSGWTVADAHIYVDDGISGAEFTNRPGFLRLMNSLKSHAPFQVLIVSELSRVGREQFETGYALKQLSQAGVTVYSYLEDRPIALDSPVDKFLLSAVNFAAEVERDKARQRVTDAMVRKALAGYVTGGRCFGYDNIAITNPDGRRSHVERRINPREAEIVRAIFRRCAAGQGVKAIAKALNAAGVPAPRPVRGRPAGWAPSSVRSVLFRRTYLGELRYGMTRKRDMWGQRRTQKRPNAEVLVVDQPLWRTVSQGEWDAAHARHAASAAALAITAPGSSSRPRLGVASKYLLSGLARCASCGGSLIAHVTSDHSRRFPYYICSTFSNRGRTVCANGLALPMAAADVAVLDRFEQILVAPVVIDAAIAAVVAERQAPPAAQETKRAALLAELQQVEEEQRHLAAGIAAAGDIDVLARDFQDAERRRRLLRGQLVALDRRPQVVLPGEVARLERDLRARLEGWRRLLRQYAPNARQMLARLIDGRLTFTPEPKERRYRFSGTASLGNLVWGEVLTSEGPSVPLVWCARKDRNPNLRVILLHPRSGLTPPPSAKRSRNTRAA